MDAWIQLIGLGSDDNLFKKLFSKGQAVQFSSKFLRLRGTHAGQTEGVQTTPNTQHTS